MSDKKFGAEFIKGGYDGSNRVGHGSFVETFDVGDKPFQKGKYVIKEYAYPYGKVTGEKRLFGDKSRESLMVKAKILKERYEKIKDFLADVLPQAVLPTNYMVGRKEGEEGGCIFEVQERLPPHSMALNIVKQSENFLTDLLGAQGKIKGNHDLGNKLEKLQSQVKLFMGKIDDLLQDKSDFFHDYLPDWDQHNIAFTGEGEIRLFDFNFMEFRAGDFGGAEKVLMRTRRELKNMLVFIKAQLNIVAGTKH